VITSKRLSFLSSREGHVRKTKKKKKKNTKETEHLLKLLRVIVKKSGNGRKKGREGSNG